MRDEIFTPYTRIPPIGSKTNNFKNYKMESTVAEVGKHQTLPLRKRKLPPKETSKSLESGRLLIRRKTYIVLEPLVLKKEQKK